MIMKKIDFNNLNKWFAENEEYLDKIYEFFGVDPDRASALIFNKVGYPDSNEHEELFIFSMAGYLGMCELEYDGYATRTHDPITKEIKWVTAKDNE